MNVLLKSGKIPENSIQIAIGGSKSESNRLLILRAQFPNISIENLSESHDTAVLLHGLKTKKGVVNVHHAGTAMRFLTAYFAAAEGAEITLTGSRRMQQRPIKILVDALKSLGATIEYVENEGFPPLRIKGKLLQKNEVTINAGVSSQYVSALMLVAPMLPKGLSIHLEGKTTSAPYIEMTLSLLRNVGIKATFKQNTIFIAPTKNIPDKTIQVESDWSSASYFYSYVALSENMQLSLRNYSAASLQGDAVLAQLYKSFGVDTAFDVSQKAISISKNISEPPDALLLDLANTPDLAQTIAVTCFGLGIGCRLTGLHTLKIKETDRLLALKTELEKLGANITVGNDTLLLEKSFKINQNISVETYQDHRMALAFAPLALKAGLTINNVEVVSKSYPGFWEDVQKIGIACVFND